jgi:hypothetical protein
MLPSRYLAKAQPLKIKKGQVTQLKHLQAPLKGLSLSSELVAGDPLLAPILDNFVVEEDRIRVRAGTRLVQTIPAAVPISVIIPYYGTPPDYALAAGGKVYASDNTIIGTGFGSDDWGWSTFSNLGDAEYTILCNGVDGVWAWDGGNRADPAAVPVTSLSNTNPVKATVSAANIGQFANGQTVVIAGATGALAVCNGPHVIGSVGTPANTFTLIGVDGTAAASPQTTGVTADPPGSFGKQAVTAPPTEGWIVPSIFDKTLSHMNRLWFADSVNLAVYYLPLQQMAGEVKLIPLNAIFRRGGHIVALYNWTLDGGAGVDDTLAIFSSNGECAIYGGTDPDSDFSLVGIFRFDSPMSKQSVINYGGDLYCMISTGLVPMSTLLRAEAERLGKADKNIFSEFWDVSLPHRTEYGWGVVLDHHSGAAICNLPLGGQRYKQLVRFMPDPIWSTWSGIPSRTWQWIDGRLLYATDVGTVYEMSENYLNDNGNPITADVQFAWNNFGSPAIKFFKMLLPYIISDSPTQPFVDMAVDYSTSLPANQPDLAVTQLGASWDTATWDEDYWASSQAERGEWQGVGKMGRVGAPRIRVSVINTAFAIAACDVLFEQGSAIG